MNLIVMILKRIDREQFNRWLKCDKIDAEILFFICMMMIKDSTWTTVSEWLLAKSYQERL